MRTMLMRAPSPRNSRLTLAQRVEMQAVSWERKPEREPEPYWMANLVPLAT